MRNYTKYKDFLPKSYIEKKIQNNKESNKKAIWLLVALNLYMLPVNIKNVFKNDNDSVIVSTNYCNNDSFIKEIEQWINLNNFKIESLEVEGEKGTIKTLNRDVLCEIEESGYNILNITKEDTIYKANVNKGD